MSTFGIKSIDRRKSKRYRLGSHNAFAVFTPGPNSSRLLNIIDISRGGFSFKLAGNSEDYKAESEVDIFIRGDGLCLCKIPFKITSETYINKEATTFSELTKRIGAAFHHLSNSKIHQIDCFISNHTIDDPLPDTPA